MLKKYWRKLWAPVLITIILIGFFIMQLLYLLFFTLLKPELWQLLVFLVFAGGCGVSVFVLWERIKEIESGEEDDISQY